VLSAAYAAYTVYGAGITPALMATFFWRRATPKAGVASIAAGMLVTVAWEVARKILGHFPLELPAIYPALLCSVACLVLISYLEPPPDESKWKPFAA
jgi:SSS family solute:Na+ symporter